MLAYLALDSAAVPLVERLLAEGRLPALAELRSRGRLTALETPAEHYSAGTYHSLYSGLQVGEHGLYYPFQWVARDQRVWYQAALDHPEMLWEKLSRAGRRCLVIDAYEAPVPSAMHGLFLSGWQFRNRVVQREAAVADFEWRRATRGLGRAGAADEVFGRVSQARRRALRRELRAGPPRAAALARSLLRQETFDFLWLSFTPVHLGGHHFWSTSGSVDDVPDDLVEIYKSTDEAIGRVVEALPAQSDLVVYSPHGMAANRSRVDVLPQMLDRVLRGPSGRHGRQSGLWRLRAVAPAGLRAGIAKALPDAAALELTCRLETRAIDWRQTRALALPADHAGYIRLNVRGRERDGVVPPDSVDAVVKEITDGLLSFDDPDGASSLVAVERSVDLEAGARVDQLPDLVVTFPDRPPVDRMFSSQFGEVLRVGEGSGRSGNHVPDAWALVVPGAARHRMPGRPPRVTDLPATAEALLGVEMSDVRGEPLLER